MSLDRIDRVVLPFFTMGWMARFFVDTVSNATGHDISLFLTCVFLGLVLFFAPKD